ncbi:Pyridoxal-dependent decarboxylase conserved domain, putative [Synechococcus sp. PCC 7335]|uniref:pyridoxal phosphate-dependent decarboxylase family protein n=1 Tax=Synechococcus sp. (strain ATCC 29403 / PCC 7335) TaxID=91464 RepID=UPI00017EE7DE|nr:aminotransferase class V-fold PLP-dependent enzyme [Synechococcus sp. PCC 7335]EDX84286.1 Pyridoxal-dependent decarboxylase conserved domain, putative [Synechococcus sp. PCC 7335]
MFKASKYYNLLQQLENFFSTANSSSLLTKPIDPNVLKSQLSLDLPNEGKPVEELRTEITSYLNNALKTAHPSYFNQLWGGFNSACFMGDMLASATNTSMYTYEVAPAATLIEQALVTKMSGILGFKSADGQFTTGGSNGNLMAMAIARHHVLPTVKQDGMTSGPKLVAFVSREAHYSFDKAAHILGLGTEQLWKVPVDSDGRMKPEALSELVDRARVQGSIPFFVAGTAGTTVRGAFDPFEEISAIAHQENLWFHIDGAWGASVSLSATHRQLMAGANQADSLVWDAHKMMGMTLMCSLLLVKQRGQMLRTFSTAGTDYLFHDEVSAGEVPTESSTSSTELPIEELPTDFGPATMHCGRRVDALKLWLAWRHLGDRGWERLIDSYFELAQRAETIIDKHPSLELVSSRQSVNLCFRYLPQNKQQADELTLKVRQALWETGTAMVNYAQVEGKTVFRLVICNNQTRSEDIERFFEALVAIARRLEQEMC